LLFRELAVAMIAAVALSGFVALTLAPMLCSKLLRPNAPNGLSSRIDHLFDKVIAGYGRSLDAAQRGWPWLAGGVALVLGLAVWQFTTLDSELAPPEDLGIINIRLNAPEGVGFEQMNAYVAEAEKLVIPLVGGDAVRGMNARVPAGFGSSEDFDSGNMLVFLRHWDERTTTSEDVVGELNKRMGTLSVLRGNASVRAPLGRGRGQPVNFVIAGTSYDELAAARDRILAAARENPGLVNLDADYVETKPQLLIDIDHKRAGDLGISVDDVSQALQSLMGSRRVATYVRDGEEYRVIVQADESSRTREENLATVNVRSRSGVLVPLSSVISLRESATARELGRFNKMRAITLQGGLAPGYPLGKALEFLENEARQSPEVLAVGYRGESQALKQTGSSIWLVFGLSVLIVYLLLAAQFESFIHPAIIISAVPLAVAGGVFGLVLTGTTVNLYSQIGVVMLVGLAAKNGVLIIEFANQLRDAG
ncbi:MAG TPA: efflux RND transporter permease subunit, partial [Novosphingobium sp.]|nr:efflux RND transporter permease subunit [Novosphingobium sp.]